MLLAVLIPVLALVTVLLFGYALAAPAQSTVQERLRTYGYDLSRRGTGDLSRPFGERVLRPLLRRIGAFALRLTPAGMVESSRARLQQARAPISLQFFLFLRLAAVVLVPGLFLLPYLLDGTPLGPLEMVVAFCLLLIGHRVPDLWLTFRIDGRREAITRALPDALDLIVVCVEAGLSLEAAIAKVVETTHGPLADEFGQALTEISLGRSRREALVDLSARCGSPDLQTFIAAILQAEQMGVSIAGALRVQAEAMRVRRRQRAEELIAKAPVKMLFPLGVFIFPALFVVILGPAGIRISEMLGHL